MFFKPRQIREDIIIHYANGAELTKYDGKVVRKNLQTETIYIPHLDQLIWASTALPCYMTGDKRTFFANAKATYAFDPGDTKNKDKIPTTEAMQACFDTETIYRVHKTYQESNNKISTWIMAGAILLLLLALLIFGDFGSCGGVAPPTVEA